MIKIIDDEKFLTYRKIKHGEICKESIHTVIGEPSFLNKPNHAFWGCPVNSNFDWKEWCCLNEFMINEYDWDNPVYWTLKKGSKILQVDWEDIIIQERSDLAKFVVNLSDVTSIQLDEKVLDFNKILEADICAVQLMDGGIGHSFGFLDDPYETMFNSWDCDSIVVLDESKIVF